MNRIDIINECLRTQELDAIESIDVDYEPYAAEANSLIDKVNKELQSTGCYFNKYSTVLQKNSNNEIILPANTLYFYAKDISLLYTIRNNKLYDLKNQTFEFEKDVEGDIVILVDVIETPYDFYNYVYYSVVYEFLLTKEGEQMKQRYLMKMQDAKRNYTSTNSLMLNMNSINNPYFAKITGRRFIRSYNGRKV